MFSIGQKVVCVRSNGCDPALGMKIGNTYTISGFGHFCRVDRILYDVAEVRTTCEHAWPAEYFRPLQERKTDIGFAHEILRKMTKRKPVNATA